MMCMVNPYYLFNADTTTYVYLVVTTGLVLGLPMSKFELVIVFLKHMYTFCT